ncbi:MAG: cold shock domain-containing protein [Terriglobales bacterium]|jgi:cold shock CspA family protein
MRGTLTRFDLHSGVGAITTEQGMELSVHKNSMAPDGRLPKKGQLVEFRIYYGPNGPLAEDVHRLPSR